MAFFTKAGDDMEYGYTFYFKWTTCLVPFT